MQGLLLATAAVQLEVGNLPCGFLQKPRGSWKRHISPHSDSCLVWFVRPAECHQMALLVPPACTGSSHPTRTGAKMVLNEGAEHRCSPPGWEQSLMTQAVSKHFPKIVLRISDKSHICFVFFATIYRLCVHLEMRRVTGHQTDELEFYYHQTRQLRTVQCSQMQDRTYR